MEENELVSLQERSLLTIFEDLPPERKIILLKEMLKKAGRLSLRVFTDNGIDDRFYKFLSKQWPDPTISFFQKAKAIWDILITFSVGEPGIGKHQVGDMYLMSSSYKSISRSDFHEFSTMIQQFFIEANTRGVWKAFHVCKRNNDENILSYRIVDLMELEGEALDEKLVEFGYPTLKESQPWVSKAIKRLFVWLFESRDEHLYQTFRTRLEILKEKCQGFFSVDENGHHEEPKLLMSPDNPENFKFANKEQSMNELFGKKTIFLMNFKDLQVVRILPDLYLLDPFEKENAILFTDLIRMTEEKFQNHLKWLTT